MVEFRKLDLDAESKYLTLHVKVDLLFDSEGNDYFEEIGIKAIYIDTEKTFNPQLIPSSKGVLLWEATEDNGGTVKELDTAIELEFPMEIGFLYVITEGSVAENTPCTIKKGQDIGVVYNKCKLLKYSVGLLSGLDNPCEPNVNLINSLLRLKSFEIALRTGNFDLAIEYWNSFFNPKNTTTLNCAYKGTGLAPTYTIKTCGCHG